MKGSFFIIRNYPEEGETNYAASPGEKAYGALLFWDESIYQFGGFHGNNNIINQY